MTHFENTTNYIILVRRDNSETNYIITSRDELELLLQLIGAEEDVLEGLEQGTPVFYANSTPDTIIVREYQGGEADQSTFISSPNVQIGMRLSAVA